MLGDYKDYVLSGWTVERYLDKYALEEGYDIESEDEERFTVGVLEWLYDKKISLGTNFINDVSYYFMLIDGDNSYGTINITELFINCFYEYLREGNVKGTEVNEEYIKQKYDEFIGYNCVYLRGIKPACNPIYDDRREAKEIAYSAMVDIYVDFVQESAKHKFKEIMGGMCEVFEVKLLMEENSEVILDYYKTEMGEEEIARSRGLGLEDPLEQVEILINKKMFDILNEYQMGKYDNLLFNWRDLEIEDEIECER